MKVKVLALIIAVFAVTAAQLASADQIGFTSYGNASIQFSSGTFSFPDNTEVTQPPVGADFFINLGPTPFVNHYGGLSGTYQVGPITTLGPLESATVSTQSAGFVSIYDNNSTTSGVQSPLTFTNIYMVAGGGIATTATLTGWQTFGNGQHDFSQAVVDELNVNTTASLTFQFLPTTTKLQSLLSTGGKNTYSGTALAVPEPLTIVGLLTLGGCGLAFLARRRRG